MPFHPRHDHLPVIIITFLFIVAFFFLLFSGFIIIVISPSSSITFVVISLHAIHVIHNNLSPYVSSTPGLSASSLPCVFAQAGIQRVMKDYRGLLLTNLMLKGCDDGLNGIKRVMTE